MQKASAELTCIPIFYTPRMVANPQCFSPSPGKPALVVESWRKLALAMQFIEPSAVDMADLHRVHAPDFVDAILDLSIDNGCSTRELEFVHSLFWTNGAMLSAARRAIENGRVAVAPVSGFHHAGYDYCGGFCTFNGLMVTAAALMAAGQARRVGILDFDQHWGDGTEHIIRRLEVQSQIVHYSPVRQFSTVETAKAFLAAIPRIADLFIGCDVVLYQAGADPHVRDPLGGWLSTQELHTRDDRVFAELSRRRIPVAWNLAGGYQEPIRRVLDIHDNTMRACGLRYLSA